MVFYEQKHTHSLRLKIGFAADVMSQVSTGSAVHNLIQN